jgi:hypothetical protein
MKFGEIRNNLVTDKPICITEIHILNEDHMWTNHHSKASSVSYLPDSLNEMIVRNMCFTDKEMSFELEKEPSVEQVLFGDLRRLDLISHNSQIYIQHGDYETAAYKSILSTPSDYDDLRVKKMKGEDNGAIYFILEKPLV